MQVEYSRQAYEAGEKSAYAWMAFFPFVVPIFVLEAVKYVVPTAILIEIAIYFFGRK